MTTPRMEETISSRRLRDALIRAWLLTAVIDGSWAVALSLIYKRPIIKLWQGVAATLFGDRMLDGGVPTALLGVAMHVGVAFAWSAIFLLLVLRSPWLRGVLASPGGVFKVATVFGPMIWVVMSFGVIPLLVHRFPTVTYRWFIQLAGHAVFVGLPIVSSIARVLRAPQGELTRRPARL